jgi:excisionase family DNA binding protein
MTQRTDWQPAPAEKAALNRNSNSPSLLTAEQLAERWQMPGKKPAAAIYRLTREGKLPAVALGRYYRYRLSDIEEFEANGGTGG